LGSTKINSRYYVVLVEKTIENLFGKWFEYFDNFENLFI